MTRTALPIHIRALAACTSCPPGAALDSAHHWIDTESFVRLDPDGTSEVAMISEDLPPSRLGAPRCGGAEGHRLGIRRPGGYSVGADEVILFEWDDVALPDTAGLWVTSEEVSITDGVPIGGPRLLSLLMYKGREVPVVLRFPILAGPAR